MGGMQVSVDEHPLLELTAFSARLPRPLADVSSSPELLDLLRLDATAPLTRDEAVRAAVRDLLRHGGYKPTGRGKPASEYLVRAAGEDKLSAINLVVDACNVVSLHSGLPISVVDLDLARAPLRVGLAPADAEYVFNAGGQTIRLGGLLCLHDADGPCANGVRDSQRTKTHAGTERILALVWGTRSHPGRGTLAARWYRDLLEAAGAHTEEVGLTEA
jgi:DNA/RNA-binding domain of Phe-tRNA-synthetase-like protein